MWQILGITTMDVYRIIDWAIDTFDLNDDVVVGGYNTLNPMTNLESIYRHLQNFRSSNCFVKRETTI